MRSCSAWICRSVVLALTALAVRAWGQPYLISTVAGGALPVNIKGTSALLYNPQDVAADAAGNLISSTRT